ncbi:Splicing factor U2AF 50 kDa subunit [Verticillium dahliae VDG1]|nr:Splicing factor U2AF 50 kDa subunit [Verticillium dahliae VDG1]
MLGSIDQSPRLSWHGFLNIEPNTYIAIIATASRTATTVPIASCLSQLKWRHFQSRAHRLNHLDLIDKASRGPWGSLQALFMLGKANMVISMLAITTILSLAIGPSVQQVLEIHTREAIDYSLVPELAYATNYTSKVLYTTQTPDDWTTRRYLPWSTEPLRRRDLDDRDDSVYWVAPSTNAEMVLDPQSRDNVMDTVAFFLKEILSSLTSDSSSSIEGISQEQYVLKNPLSAWILLNGLRTAIWNMAETLDSHIQSKEHGDNIEGMILGGEMLTEEVYFNVRWAWMTVITLETLCVTLLLAFTSCGHEFATDLV